MSYQCVACCEVSMTKVSLFACSDFVDVSLYDALVSRQVICTSGSIEFPDKSYNSFEVSVEILVTFDKFKLYPYILNSKSENLRTICNQR
jgi:hypothetical protein